MKHFFPWTSLSISKTVHLGNGEPSSSCIIITAPPKSHGLVPPKDLLSHFSNAKRLLLSSTWTFCINLWWYNMHWRNMRTPHGSCKTVLLHRTSEVTNFLYEHFDDCVIALAYLKHLGSSMDWPPCSTDLTPYDFFPFGEGEVLVKLGVPPKSANYCRAGTARLCYCIWMYGKYGYLIFYDFFRTCAYILSFLI